MKPRNRIAVTQNQRLQLSPAMATSLQVLQLNAAELNQFLKEQAEAIPALQLSKPKIATGQWLPRWTGIFGHDPQSIDSLADHGPSLMAHVLAAIPNLVVDQGQRHIAIALAEALAPTGWLERDLASIAAELGVAPSAVTEVLLKLQKIDPAGLFARSLSECLLLQARELEEHDPILEKMLSKLDLVAGGDWSGLARHCDASLEEINQRFRILRGFNPKPGLGFSSIASPVREPDLTVHQSEGGWHVALNGGVLPSLSLEGGVQKDPRAAEVLRLLEARNATLLRVGQVILKLQEAALLRGPAALCPMTMQEVADLLDIHKSTVSRVVSGTSVDTPHGTWWLRALFSPDMGGGLSAAALKARIAGLIAGECSAAPLSDDQLADLISQGGATVARRTVAKYRSELKIPSVWRRRKN